jgi:type III pantothenate kinase
MSAAAPNEKKAWALLIDLGNSQLKWAWHHPDFGLFPAEPLPSTPEKRPQFWQALEQRPLETLENGRFAGQSVRQVYLANTRGSAEEADFVRQLEEKTGCSVRNLETPATAFGVTVAYADPARLGIDRWLGMLAATDCFSNENLAILSLGTAITLDLLGADGTHLGGWIWPGARLMRRCLTEQIATLKDVAVSDPVLTPGCDTASAVSSGLQHLFWGGLNSGLAEAARLWQQNGASFGRVVVHGGGAPGLMEQWSVEPQRLAQPWQLIYQPDLVLRGLSRYNSASFKTPV